MPEKEYYPAWFKWPIASLGGVVGWLVVHPMDLLKVRMQLAHVSLGGAVKSIVAERGPLGLYDGLSAGIARQLVYATARLGLYDTFRDIIAKDRAPTFLDRALAGVSSGGVAAMMSCPVEVTLVRMQADSRLPVADRRGYKNVFDGLLRIAREEGVSTYWRGSTPTVVRAMAVGLTQVCFYDQIKATLLQYKVVKEGTPVFVTASLITGLLYSFLTMPIETCKTRMQEQRPRPDGTLKYNSLPGALMNIAKEEGVARLWRGYLPYYGRCGGHTVGCFLAIEWIKQVANKAYEPKERPPQ